jgi:hypothetical protein
MTASMTSAEQRALFFANVKPLLASDALVMRTRRAVRRELESRTARRSLLLRTLIPSLYCLGMAFLMMMHPKFAGSVVLPLAGLYYLLFALLIPWLVVRKEKEQTDNVLYRI